MTTPHRIPHALRRPLQSWSRRLVDAIGELAGDPTTHQATPNRSRSVNTEGAHPVRPAGIDTTHPECARVTHVEDPDGAGVIVRVVGRCDQHTVDRIDELTFRLEPHSNLHLDLWDAAIPLGPVMHELGLLADRLEQALVRVRMTGLDPHQPAIELR